MRNITAYSHQSRKGPFWAIKRPDGRWHAFWEQEDLGEYETAQQAVEALASGTTYWPSCGNPASFALSDDIDDWIAHGPR